MAKVQESKELRAADFDYGMSADKFLAKLQKVLAATGVPLEDITITLLGYDDYGNPSGALELYYQRDETVEDRVAKKKRLHHIEEYERIQFANLSKKYGKGL